MMKMSHFPTKLEYANCFHLLLCKLASRSFYLMRKNSSRGGTKNLILEYYGMTYSLRRRRHSRPKLSIDMTNVWLALVRPTIFFHSYLFCYKQWKLIYKCKNQRKFNYFGTMSDAIVAIIFKNNNNILYTHIMYTQLMLELILIQLFFF